jgi:hypothetical protein
VILTGDSNQRYESGAKAETVLAVRTETMGLTSSLAERFQEFHCDYAFELTRVLGHNGKGGAGYSDGAARVRVGRFYILSLATLSVDT